VNEKRPHKKQSGPGPQAAAPPTPESPAGRQPAWIVDVTDETFEQEVVRRSYEKPVVIDFWAEWCEPCRALKPLLEQAINERRGLIVLARINVDQAQAVAHHFELKAIPFVVAVRNGRALLQFEGVLPLEHLRRFLDEISPSESEMLVAQAKELEDGQPEKAEALYRKSLEKDPTMEAARVGLARVLIAQNKEEGAQLLESLSTEGEFGAEVQQLKSQLALQKTLGTTGDIATLQKQVEAEPKNAELRCNLGQALAAAGKYPEALAMLLSAAELDPALAASKVREAMVQIFYAVGPSSALANDYRSKLARLLY
jgi:putative thioredoxin